MPNPQITADFLLNLHTKEIEKELEKAISSGINHASRAAKKLVADTFREAVIDSLTDSKTGSAMKNLLSSGVIEAQQEFLKLQQKIEGLQTKATEQDLTKKEKAQLKRLQEEARSSKAVLDDKYKAFKREQELLRSAAKAQRGAAKNFADGMENAARNLQGVFGGGFGGAIEALRGLGVRAHKQGESEIERARKKGMEGKLTPDQIEKAAGGGRRLARMGAGLAAFAGIAGTLLILIKLFADIESKVKDMNKALIASAGAADFGLGHIDIVTGELQRRLEEIRDVTADVNDTFWNFGATFREQQNVLAELNQAGYTYAKMTKGMETAAQRAQSYTDALTAALTYSRVFGASSSEMARKMGEFTLETGSSLEDIANQFSTITNEAMRAGFTTKRFYAAVTEATSGMAFYGIRIEETAKMLSNFDSLLGETVGADAFKRLVGQYRDVGEQQKLKDIIVKGEGLVAKELERAFDLRVAELQRDFGEKLGGANIAEMLTTMTEQELRQQLQVKGLGPEEIRRFAIASRLGKAPQKGLGAMTEAMGVAGPGFDVAMAMNASRVFQGKNIGEVARQAREARGPEGAAIRSALESVANAQGMKLDMLIELFENSDATWQNILRLQNKIRANEGDRTKLSKEERDLLEKLEKKQGIVISDLGDKITKDGMELRDAMDIVRVTSVADKKKLSQQFSKDQEIAIGISENIYGLNETMEQTIAAILNNIYGVVSAIARKFLSDSDELVVVQQIEAAKKEKEKAVEELKQKRERLRNIEVGLRTAQGDSREKLLQEREGLLKEKEQAQRNVKKATILEKVAKTTKPTEFLDKAVTALGKAGIEVGKESVQKTLKGRETDRIMKEMWGGDAESGKLRQALYHELLSPFSDVTAEDILNYREMLSEENKAHEKFLVDTYGAKAVAEAKESAKKALIEKMPEIGEKHAFAKDEIIAGRAVYDKAFQQALLRGPAQKEIKGNALWDSLIEKPLQKAKELIGPGTQNAPVNVNIYGGDQKVVYDTVMKAMKALGRA